jgi:hypothetical protein
MNGTPAVVDASSPALSREEYENDGAKMIFAITRLAEANRLNVYQGTVPAKVKAKRRAAGKLAKAARKASR